MKLLALIEKTKKGKFRNTEVYRLYMPNGGEDGVLMGWRADWPESHHVEFRGPAYSEWTGDQGSDFERLHDALEGRHSTVLHTNDILDVLPTHPRYEVIKNAIEWDEMPPATRGYAFEMQASSLRLCEDEEEHIITHIKEFAKQHGILIELSSEAGFIPGITVTDLYADNPGSGGGTKVLNELISLADQHEVMLFIWPEGERNRLFYERFGFVMTQMPPQMIRVPNFDLEEFEELRRSENLDENWELIVREAKVEQSELLNMVSVGELTSAIRHLTHMTKTEVSIFLSVVQQQLGPEAMQGVITHWKDMLGMTEADSETLKLPDLDVGDELMVGKFKNRNATIKGFTKDKHNQPIAKTDKGDQQIFKGRVKKLMKQAMAEAQNWFKGSTFSDEQGNNFDVEAVVSFAQANAGKYLRTVPMSKIEHDLEWWEQDPNKDRMMGTDTRYPILVVVDNGHWSVADGLNRMKKARDVEGKTAMQAYVVPKEDIAQLAESASALKARYARLYEARGIPPDMAAKVIHKKDLEEYREWEKSGEKVLPFNVHTYRVTGFYCPRTPPKKGMDDMNQILSNLLWDAGDDFDKMRPCQRKDATHITASGVAGLFEPIENVVVVGRVNWSPEQIQKAKNQWNKTVMMDTGS